jgi:predicted nuclease of predicted toxin-antitoxin system
MRLLLDQGLPSAACAILNGKGHDSVHVNQVGLQHSEDTAILELARAEGRAVVTLDADFHALLALSGAVQPSVVRIRIEGLKAAALAASLEVVLNQCGKEIEAGAAVSVLSHEIRIHKLPIGKVTQTP